MGKLRTVAFLLIFTLLTVGCSSNKALKTDKQTDKLRFQMESDHFIFYSSEKDKKCLKDLSKVLESNYQRITNNLQVTINEKIKIYIHPDIDTYHRKMGMTNAGDWVVGSAYGKTIQMVSPLNPGKSHTYDDILKVVVHEFVHVAESYVNPEILKAMGFSMVWLLEGVAMYEAKQMDHFEKDFIKEQINKEKIPSLEMLETENFANLGGYKFSYTIIEYIVDIYGYTKLVELIKHPEDFEKIFEVSKIEFEGRWRAFLKENYNGNKKLGL